MYNWTETKVDVKRMVSCEFGTQEEGDGGMAKRLCAEHDVWDDPMRSSPLTYDGSECITNDTFQLRKLAKVSLQSQ